MPIVVSCPQCFHAYRLQESLIGKKVRCKNCGNIVLVRAPGSKPAEEPAIPFVEEVATPAPQEPPPIPLDFVDENPNVIRAREAPVQQAPAGAPQPRPQSIWEKQADERRRREIAERRQGIVKAVMGLLALVVVALCIAGYFYFEYKRPAIGLNVSVSGPVKPDDMRKLIESEVTSKVRAAGWRIGTGGEYTIKIAVRQTGSKTFTNSSSSVNVPTLAWDINILRGEMPMLATSGSYEASSGSIFLTYKQSEGPEAAAEKRAYEDTAKSIARYTWPRAPR